MDPMGMIQHKTHFEIAACEIEDSGLQQVGLGCSSGIELMKMNYIRAS